MTQATSNTSASLLETSTLTAADAPIVSIMERPVHEMDADELDKYVADCQKLLASPQTLRAALAKESAELEAKAPKQRKAAGKKAKEKALFDKALSDLGI